jgi:UDPglucose 6-dehydrogenase/UDP-N-acetyl-D-galactosamine dehydrogenase
MPELPDRKHDAGQISVQNKTVCIVGLGYVGFPLAEAFSHKVTTLGFDIDINKIKTIQESGTAIQATADPAQIRTADFVMICVPTLLTPDNEPDLSYVRSAAETVGRNMKKGAIIILESTVYPGVTEDILRPVLERASGYVCGRDFKVGYSPERINPGDDEHVLAKTTKIVAGMDDETSLAMNAVYNLITQVYTAPDIRTAEAAKVVENIQRDVNIALINELSYIFHHIGINTKQVLEAAGTKWNFHRYTPGIVGGHCIPTVPYFLAYSAKQSGYTPEMILAGRATNDYMTSFIAELITNHLNSCGKPVRNAGIVILGLTYKEDVADTRDNPVTELIRNLKEQEITVYGYDPLLTPVEIARMGVIPLEKLDKPADGFILVVPHKQFLDSAKEELRHLAKPDVVFVDIKGIFYKDPDFKKMFRYITL